MTSSALSPVAAPLPQQVVQKLQLNILKGAGRAVPQRLAIKVVVQAVQGSNGRVVKAPAIVSEPHKLINGGAVEIGQERFDHRARQGGVIGRRDPLRIQPRQFFRDEEPTAGSRAQFDCFRRVYRLVPPRVLM